MSRHDRLGRRGRLQFKRSRVVLLCCATPPLESVAQFSLRRGGDFDLLPDLFARVFCCQRFVVVGGGGDDGGGGDVSL